MKMPNVHQAEEHCEEYRTNLLGDVIKEASPYIYPFTIEFALIGASVFYLMSNHIGKRFSATEYL
jgi:hypothetical protein